MGAPVGNTNGRKSRMFEQALIREIKQRDIEKGEGETLRAIVSGLIDKAQSGDIVAVKDVRDTLDGKPAQALAIGGDPDGVPLETRMEVKLVKPGAEG